jgi:hypothetical protein
MMETGGLRRTQKRYGANSISKHEQEIYELEA